MAVVLKGVEPKSIDLEDGAYQGKIKLGEVREASKGTDKFFYYDLFLELKDKNNQPIELKVGYAIGAGNTISPKGKLGALVERFTGESVKANQDYDLNKIFDDRDVKFLVMKNPKSGFFDVTQDSVKPVDSVQVEKELHTSS